MWLSTTVGFFSIVQHRDAQDQYLVRARVENDLHNLKKLAVLSGEVLITPMADYPCRVYITQTELLRIMTTLVTVLDYPNFKNRIGQLPDQQSKLSAYHEVWAIMKEVE